MKKINHYKTKIIGLGLSTLVGCLIFTVAAIPSYAWRAENLKSVNGYALCARADLPYFANFSGGGNWTAQAEYCGNKTDNQLTLAWSFYSIGGKVSYTTIGISGYGNSSGSSYSVKNSVANASGRVYGNGLCFYIGMDTTASFSYGNNYYSTTAHI